MMTEHYAIDEFKEMLSFLVFTLFFIARRSFIFVNIYF